MSNKIQLLPDHVANQIAAGEVVQRPASVVKELIENAVDAKSTTITLVVKEAGKTLIQVIDNGVGMNVTDARLCFERHATSKIRKAEDLFDLHTKGFRGEALASIAAIAHVELKTRQAEDELGVHLQIEGSEFISQEPAVVPKGTSFLVKNLFYNIPARRNFLKSNTVEMRHIMDEFIRVALAHPEIQFILMNNGEELYNLPSSNLRQRIVNIFSGKTNEKLVPIEEVTEIVSLRGFVSKPEFAKKNKGEQFFFVNNRFIRSPYLHHAVMAAYEGLLKEGMHPAYFIFLEVPPHTIDINIHPTKTEVKFDDEQALYAILRSSVKHSLGQFNVAPVLDFERDPNLDTPYSYTNMKTSIPTIEVDVNFNPFAIDEPQNSLLSSRNSGDYTGSANKGNSMRSFSKSQTASWESLYVGLKEDFETSQESELTSSAFHAEEPQEFEALSLWNDNPVETSTFSSYQLHKKYIVTPIKSGILIIDQQRAHQRIIYEECLRNVTIKQASIQQLLFPLQLYFPLLDVQLFRALESSLYSMGFSMDTSNDDSIILRGIPTTITESQASIVLDALLNDFREGIPEESFSQADQMAKAIARSMAIRTGVSINAVEQESIVNSLFACKEPNLSPFQKTTFITLSVEDLDKKFAI